MASKLALEITALQSPSKIETFERKCEQQWAFIYVEGMRRKPNGALKFGGAWDRFASDPVKGYWFEKKRDGKDLKPAQAVELFDSMWKEEATEVEEWKEGESLDDLGNLGRLAVPKWQAKVGEIHWPDKLQQKFQFSMDSGEWSIRGILDTTLFHRDDDTVSVIHDDKTSASTWMNKSGPNEGKPTRKATASMQPAAYTLAAKVDPDSIGPKADLDRFVFDVMVKTKATAIESIEVPVTDDDRMEFTRMAASSRVAQQQAVDRGYFHPNRDSFLCSKRWCGFWQSCIEQHGGEVPE